MDHYGKTTNYFIRVEPVRYLNNVNQKQIISVHMGK